MDKPVVYICDNCSTVYHDEEQFKPLQDVKALLLRVAPGEVMPAGECLQCESFVHKKTISTFEVQRRILAHAGLHREEMVLLCEEDANLGVETNYVYCNVQLRLPLQEIYGATEND